MTLSILVTGSKYSDSQFLQKVLLIIALSSTGALLSARSHRLFYPSLPPHGNNYPPFVHWPSMSKHQAPEVGEVLTKEQVS